MCKSNVWCIESCMYSYNPCLCVYFFSLVRLFLCSLRQESVRAWCVDHYCTSKHKVSKLCLLSLSMIGPHPSTLWYVHGGYGLLRLREQQGHPTPATCCCECFLLLALFTTHYFTEGKKRFIIEANGNLQTYSMYMSLCYVCKCNRHSEVWTTCWPVGGTLNKLKLSEDVIVEHIPYHASVMWLLCLS